MAKLNGKRLTDIQITIISEVLKEMSDLGTEEDGQLRPKDMFR